MRGLPPSRGAANPASRDAELPEIARPRRVPGLAPAARPSPSNLCRVFRGAPLARAAFPLPFDEKGAVSRRIAAMATEIRVPTLGESISEATVGKWFKQRGDAVKADEPLVELETDKVTLEVNAPAAGVLTEIAAETGQTVAIGALLGGFSRPPAPSTRRRAASPPRRRRRPSPRRRRCRPRPRRPRSPARTRSISPASPAAASAARFSRATRSRRSPGRRRRSRRASSPRRHRRAAADAVAPRLAPIAARAPSTPDDAAREERVRLTKLRQTIARRLKDAQNTAAMLTTFNEVDMSEVMAMRARYKDAFEKKHGAKLGFMGFFVKACVQALKEIPAVNAEIDGADLVYKNYYHLGIAVGTDKGLVVPVVRDADQLSVAGDRKGASPISASARATAS